MTSFQFTELQKELILKSRTSAARVVGSLLRRSNCFLDRTEIQSIADIALCEAARNFDSDRGNSFMSYLFLYLKGAVMKEIKKNQRISVIEGSYLSATSYSSERIFESNELVDESASPEELFRHYELRAVCRSALQSLLPLERNTIIGIDILGSNVTKFAQSIGYSRPYLSSVRKKAIQKMQPYFEKLAA
jgi:RNA polymerase sigma factor (sigma-70 family)